MNLNEAPHLFSVPQRSPATHLKNKNMTVIAFKIGLISSSVRYVFFNYAYLQAFTMFTMVTASAHSLSHHKQKAFKHERDLNYFIFKSLMLTESSGAAVSQR